MWQDKQGPYTPRDGEGVKDLVHGTEGVCVGSYKQEIPECTVYRVKNTKTGKVANLRDYQIAPVKDAEE